MTTPITFTTNVQDKGALAFLKALGQALSSLSSTKDVGPDLDRAAAAAKTGLQAAKDQLQAAKDQLFTTRQQAQVADEMAAQLVRNARLAVTAARDAGREQVAAAKAAGAAQVEAADAALVATRERAAESIDLSKQEALAAREAAAAKVEGEQAALRASLQQLEFEQRQLLVIKDITAEGIRGAEARVAGARAALQAETNALAQLRINIARQALAGPVSEEQQAANQAAVVQGRQDVQTRRLILQDAQAALKSTQELEASEIALQEARITEGESAVEASKAAVSGAEAATIAVRNETNASITAAKERADADIEAARAAQVAAEAAARAGVVAARGAAGTGVGTAVSGVAAAEEQANATRLAGTEAIRAATAQVQLEQANTRSAASAAQSATQELRLAEAEAAATAAALEQGTAVNTIGSGWKQILEIFAAIEAAKLFSDFIRSGTEFNQTIETATLGIASLITAEGQLRDAQGNLLQGVPALNAALELSTEQVNKLRIAGLETAATTTQLVDAFQQAVAAGLAAGLNLDQIRQVTVQIVQAATAIGVPLNQLNQEVRSILQGTIDRNSRVAKVLLITNEEVRQAKERGTLQDLLNTKLQAFTVAGERAASTMQVLKSNIKEAFQVFAGTSTQPFFDTLKQAGLKALEGVFDIPNARISEDFQGIVKGLQAGFGGLGKILSDAIEGAVSGAQRLSEFLNENHAEIVVLTDAFFDMSRQIVGIVGDVAGIVVDMIKWAVQSGTLRSAFQLVADLIKIIRQDTADVALVVGGLTLAFVGAEGAAAGLGAVLTLITATNPWLIAISALVALGIEIENVIHQRDRELAQLKDQRTEYGKNTASAIALAREYGEITDKLNGNKLNAQEAASAQDRLRTITEQLNKLGIATVGTIDKETGSHLSVKQAIDQEIESRVALLRLTSAGDVDALNKAEDARTDFLNKSLKNGLIGQKVFDQLTADPLSDISGGKVFAVFKQQFDALNAKVKIAHDNLATIQPAIKAINDEFERGAKPKVTANPAPEDDKGKEQKLAEARKEAKAALEEAQAEFTEADAGLKTRLAEHQISIGQYFAALAQLQDTLFAKEAAAQKALISAAVAFGKPGDIAEAKSGLDKINALQQKAREQNARDELKARNDLDAKVASAQVELLKETGHTQDAALIELQQKYKNTIAELIAEIAAGGPGAQKAASQLIDVTKLIDIKTLQIDVDEMRRIIREGETKASEDIQAIRDKQNASLITGDDANKQILAVLQQQRLELLQNLAVAEALATALGDTDSLKAADLLKQKLAQLGVQIQTAELAVHSLHQSIKDASLNVLDDFLANGIAQAKSFSDAMRNLAISILQSIDQIVSKLIAAAIIQKLFGIGANAAAGLSGSVVSSTALGIPNIFGQFAGGGYVNERELAIVSDAINSIPKFAGGGFHGFVHGPSTPVDSNLIAVTGGEYVLQPRAVKRLGVDYLDDVNFGMNPPPAVTRRRRKFASGGAVAPLAADGAGGALSGSFRAELGLGDDVVVKHLRTSKGERAVVDIIKRNPKMIRSILSGG